MARSQTTILSTGMSAIIGGLLFILMINLGYGFLTSLLLATTIASLTFVFSSMSYSYKAYLQSRAFSGKKVSNQNIDSSQVRNIEIDLPANMAFDLVLEALQQFDGQKVPVADDILIRLESLLPRKQFLKLHEVNRADGIIRAGLRAKTLGLPEFIDFSRIEIRLNQLDTNTSRIEIKSKTNTIFDMYDLGKNLHYVNELARYLRRESQYRLSSSHLSDLQDNSEDGADFSTDSMDNKSDQLND